MEIEEVRLEGSDIVHCESREAFKKASRDLKELARTKPAGHKRIYAISRTYDDLGKKIRMFIPNWAAGSATEPVNYTILGVGPVRVMRTMSERDYDTLTLHGAVFKSYAPINGAFKNLVLIGCTWERRESIVLKPKEATAVVVCPSPVMVKFGINDRSEEGQVECIFGNERENIRIATLRQSKSMDSGDIVKRLQAAALLNRLLS